MKKDKNKKSENLVENEIPKWSSKKEKKSKPKDAFDFSPKERSAKKKHEKTRNTNPQAKLIKTLKAVCIVLAALILLFIAADRFGNITFSSIGDYLYSIVIGAKRGNGYPYYFESSTPKDVKLINSDLLVVNADGTYVLDTTARKLSNLQHSYSNPLSDSSNGRAIVVDVGGYSYKVQSRTKVLYEAQMQQKILTACISQKGLIAVATRGSDSASSLTVFNKSHKEIFKWDCSKDEIVSMDISDNGKRIAVCVIGADKGELYSRVLEFDFDYQQPLFEYNFGNNTVSSVEFMKNYGLIVSGNKTLCFIDKNGNRFDYDMSLNTLSRIYTGENNVTAVLFSKYGSSSSKILTVFSEKGKILFSTQIDSSVRSICCEGSYISVLTDRKLLNYNHKGKLVGSADVSGDGIACFCDGAKVYLLTTGSVLCYKTTGTNEQLH